MKSHYVIDTLLQGDADSIPIYAWGETADDAIMGVMRELIEGGIYPLGCYLNKEWTEVLQAEHRRVNRLPWWKKPFAARFKWPHEVLTKNKTI